MTQRQMLQKICKTVRKLTLLGKLCFEELGKPIKILIISNLVFPVFFSLSKYMHN